MPKALGESQVRRLRRAQSGYANGQDDADDAGTARGGCDREIKIDLKLGRN
jgi:hypothetical protein